MAEVLNSIDLLNPILVNPELLQVYALVQTPDASNLVRAEEELLEHGQAIELPDRFNFITSQPHFLKKSALIDTFDFSDSLIDYVELH